MATIHQFPTSKDQRPASVPGARVAALYESFDIENLIRHRNLIDAALTRKGRPTKPYSALTALDLLPSILRARQDQLRRHLHIEVSATGITAFADGALPLYSTGTAADALSAIDGLLAPLPEGA